MFVTKNGRTIIVEGNISCQFKDGRPVACRSIFHDITERKRAEKVQSVLLQISEATSISRNLDDLYSIIHQQLGKLVNTRNFYIALYDAENDLYTIPCNVDEYDEDTESTDSIVRLLYS